MPAFDPDQLTHAERYRLGISSVVPRPIAWMSTCDEDGSTNLAPFSYFMAVCASPLTLAVSIGDRLPPKDTLRNLQRSNETVVHLTPPELFAQMHSSGGEYAPGISEADHLGVDLVNSTVVKPRRLREADVAFECRLAQAIPIGTDGKGVTLCVLTVVHVHISERVSDADGFPDPHLMRAPARLGGQSYLSPESWTVVDLPRERPPAELALKRPNAGK